MSKINKDDIGRRFVDRSGFIYTVMYCFRTDFGFEYTCEMDTGERVPYGSTGQRLVRSRSSAFEVYGGGEHLRFDMWQDETREQTIDRARREYWNTIEAFTERMIERMATPAYLHLSDEDKELVFSRP